MISELLQIFLDEVQVILSDVLTVVILRGTSSKYKKYILINYIFSIYLSVYKCVGIYKWVQDNGPCT